MTTSTGATTGTGTTTGGVGSQVTEAAGDVASTAADEVRGLAHEATEQARTLASELKDQVEEQSQAGLDRLVESLRALVDDLSSMADGQGGTDGQAAQLVRQASDRGRTWVQSLEGRSAGDLLGEVDDFARRKPGTFLLAALAGGVVVGRMTRGVASASSTGTRSHTVDLRDGSPMSGMTPGAPGSSGMVGGAGPGSLGMSAMEGDLWVEEGNAMRTGAGQGLGVEQGSAFGSSAEGRGAETPGSVGSALTAGISSADDTPGGPVEFDALRDPVRDVTEGRATGPEVQP